MDILHSDFKALPDDLEFAKDVLTGTSLLQQRAAEIRSQKINWPSYMQSQMISSEELQFITTFEKANSLSKSQLLDDNPAQSAKILMSMMQHISKEQTIQYLLTLIDDILQEDKSRVEIFNEYARKNQTTVWGPFLHMLNRKDGFIANQASRIIAKIACWSYKQLMGGSDLIYYLTWLKDQMKNPANEYMQTVARCLQMLMTIQEYRRPFFDLEGVQAIISLLCQKVNFQIQYQFVFCLWCLSFDSNLAERMSSYNIIPLLAEILIDSGKEKVTRITIGTMKHLLENPKSKEVVHSNCISVIRCKVLKHLQLINVNKVDDPEMIEDMQDVLTILQNAIHDLSTFDEYASEVKSGLLEWSPVHKSQKFWSENIERFNDKNFELIKTLVVILRNNIRKSGANEVPLEPNGLQNNDVGPKIINNEGTPDYEINSKINVTLTPLTDVNTIMAVACHDIGEYVRYYPPGKRVVEKLGAKQLIMSLLTNRDSSTRYEALVALQKIMVHNWEYLGKQLDQNNFGSNMKDDKKGMKDYDLISAVNAAGSKK